MELPGKRYDQQLDRSIFVMIMVLAQRALPTGFLYSDLGVQYAESGYWKKQYIKDYA